MINIKDTIKKLLKENLYTTPDNINEITSDEAWEKIYSDTSKFPYLKGNKQIFDMVDAIYPKRGNQFNKGYFNFLYNLIKNDELKDEDSYKAKQYLALFDMNSGKLPKEKRNITQFKNLPDLYDAVSGFERGSDEPQNKTQELKAIREKEIDRIYEDSQWKVVSPKTERASCLVGKGTQWCTSADKSNNMFDSYNNRGKLYILISKEDDSKYQIHFEDNQLMDSRNRALPASYFFDSILEDNELFFWFEKNIPTFYDFILKTSAEDISGGGYSETFNEALSNGSEEAVTKALDELRHGSDEDSVADGFLYEKNPDNIEYYQISNYIEHFYNTEMFQRVIEHLREIGVDLNDVKDGRVKVFLRGLDELKKYKLEMDKEYEIDKGRKLKIISIDDEKTYPRYIIKIDNDNGLVPIDTLLSYLNNKSLFENKLNEGATGKEVTDFLLSFAGFISMNLMKIQTHAKNEDAKDALAKMQKTLRGPIINGKTFFELTDPMKTPKKELFNPKFLSAVFTQVRNYLAYVKEHINRFVLDSDIKKTWLDRITAFEATYKKIIGANS